MADALARPMPDPVDDPSPLGQGDVPAQSTVPSNVSVMGLNAIKGDDRSAEIAGARIAERMGSLADIPSRMGQGVRMLGEMVNAPFSSAKKILSGAPIESVTGEDVLNLGTVMVPGYSRALGRTGVAGEMELGAFGKGDRHLTFGEALRGHTDIKTNFPDADFWIVRRGSNEAVGMPTREFSPEHIGIKVRSHLINPDYLYYAMENVHNQGFFRARGHGGTRLHNITVRDVESVPIQGPSFPAVFPGRGETELGAAGGFGNFRKPPGFKYKTPSVGDKRILQQDIPTPQKLRDFWEAMDRNKGDWRKAAEDLDIRDSTAAARVRSNAWRRPGPNENLEARMQRPGALSNIVRGTEASRIESAFKQLQSRGFSNATVRMALEREFGVADTERFLAANPFTQAAPMRSTFNPVSAEIQKIIDDIGLETTRVRRGAGGTEYLKIHDPSRVPTVSQGPREPGTVEVRVPDPQNPHPGVPRNKWMVDVSEPRGARRPLDLTRADLSGDPFLKEGKPNRAAIEARLRQWFGKHTTPTMQEDTALTRTQSDPRQLRLLSGGVPTLPHAGVPTLPHAPEQSYGP